MRKIIFLLGIAILYLGLLRCEKEAVTDNISLVKTMEGGCNSAEFSEYKNVTGLQPDTFIFSTKHDTLNVFVGINYICCTPFINSPIVTRDSIIITIKDPCSTIDALCYCDCMCYYKWNFLFIDYERKEYAFKLILIDPQVEEPVVYWEGTIDLSNNN